MAGDGNEVGDGVLDGVGDGEADAATVGGDCCNLFPEFGMAQTHLLASNTADSSFKMVLLNYIYSARRQEDLRAVIGSKRIVTNTDYICSSIRA